MASTPDDGLSVQRQTSRTSSVNPALRPLRTPSPDVRDLFDAVRAGDRVALGRAITLLESGLPADRERALELLDLCQPVSGSAVRVGFSGAPGVGKSTLIDTLGAYLVEAGRRVAVLAVDPSSERSGGSILGDKTRMGRLAAMRDAFIRPTPAGGSLGGVARFTRATIPLVEAAGFDVVIVETVGVGQSETAVRHMIDTFVLLSLAGAGDELQGIKRGIIEAADAVAVTKADGANRDGALTAATTLRQAIGLLPPDDEDWRPPVLAVSAFEPDSVLSLWTEMERHRQHLADTGGLARLRQRQAVRWLRNELTDRLLDRFRNDPALSRALAQVEAAVSDGKRHPYRAAEELVTRFLTSGA